MPTSAGEVQNFLSSPSLRDDQDQFTLRMDQAVGTRDNVFARLTYANMATFQPYGNTNLNETLVPGFGYHITTKTRNAAMSATPVSTGRKAARSMSEPSFANHELNLLPLSPRDPPDSTGGL